MDGSGNVYIPDNGNHRVVKVNFADAPALSFATTDVGATSSDSPQVVTVGNIGNAPLTFPIPATGNNPSLAAGFSLDDATTCPRLDVSSATAGTLAQGESCTYAVNFVPTEAGAVSGALVLKDDKQNAPAPNYAIQSIGPSGTVTAVLTTTALVSSANPVFYGQSASLTATVSAASETPTGTATFLEGDSVIGTGMLNGGQATLTISPSAETHSYVAAYGGDSRYAAGNSATLTQVVSQAATTSGLALTSGANPSVYGQTLVFMSSVQG